MTIKEICSHLEKLAAPSLQESYDNSGLLIGDKSAEVTKALITLDVTDTVLDEAIEEGCGLIIAHHPVIFKGLIKLTGSTLTERIVIRAIKNDLAIYAIHTNLDNVSSGVNAMLAEKLGLTQTQILSPIRGNLRKLVTFSPKDYADKVRKAIFDAGAGHIGEYDCCSYNTEGKGSFRALEGTNPFVGEQGKIHYEEEIRIETILPEFLVGKVLKAMIEAHPYEEVAYDVYLLDNINTNTGAGMIGELNTGKSTTDFMKEVKKVLGSAVLKHSPLIDRPVKKVAICGGSGSFLIHTARAAGADVFITGDIKYHDYFDYHGEMTIVDAGHYETEQFTKDLLATILKQKFPTFALLNSRVNTNPVSVF
jgi:dinuclear metal center YbgI/SA1388 family protein